MSLDTRGMMDALTSLAGRTGQFDTVIGHEPKAAPTLTGVTCAVWLMSAKPTQSSGLASVSMVVEFWMRCYTSMLQEPQDLIDPRVMDGADALMGALCGNFQLNRADTRYVDLLGSDSDGLRSVAGYLTQDNKTFRTIDVMVPVLCNDIYSEVA
jgi:hypothetical protein